MTQTNSYNLQTKKSSAITTTMMKMSTTPTTQIKMPNPTTSIPISAKMPKKKRKMWAPGVPRKRTTTTRML
jgi:hypothetical protein